MATWKRLERRTIYDSPYMKVWEDSVQLPSGKVIDDYSGVTLPDGVIVVATDTENRMILIDEYKYAVDDTILTFPAGGIDKEESPLEAAARELLEETGHESTDLELLAKEYPYPSKVSHTNYIVRAKNAQKITKATQEATESISRIQLIPIDKIPEMKIKGNFTTSYMIAAVALAFPELWSVTPR